MNRPRPYEAIALQTDRMLRRRGNTPFDPQDGFGPAYRAFFDIDLGQRFEWLEHDGARLAVQRFVPTGEAVGDAVLVHGYYDHVGLYGHAIRYLLGRGFRVHAYDQEGHGLSSGEQASIASFDLYASALAAFVETVPTSAGVRWIVGQSMGGSVALEHLDRHPEAAFDRIVLLAPLVRPWQWPLNRLVWLAARPFVRSVPRTFAANTDNLEFLPPAASRPLAGEDPARGMGHRDGTMAARIRGPRPIQPPAHRHPRRPRPHGRRHPQPRRSETPLPSRSPRPAHSKTPPRERSGQHPRRDLGGIWTACVSNRSACRKAALEGRGTLSSCIGP